jgi:hypothetical protein
VLSAPTSIISMVHALWWGWANQSRGRGEETRRKVELGRTAHSAPCFIGVLMLGVEGMIAFPGEIRNFTGKIRPLQRGFYTASTERCRTRRASGDYLGPTADGMVCNCVARVRPLIPTGRMGSHHVCAWQQACAVHQVR